MRSTHWQMADDCQLGRLDAERVLVKHTAGSTVVDARLETIAALVQRAESEGVEAALETVPLASRRDAASLLSALERPRSPAPRRIVVLASGAWGNSVGRLVGASLVGSVVLETCTLGKEVNRAIFDESDLVVCAVEGVRWSLLAELNRAAIASRRAATLFALFHHGAFTLGPFVRPGVPPCLLCERVDELGRDGDDPELPALFEALTVESSSACPAWALEEARGMVLSFVRRWVEGVEGAACLAGRVETIRDGGRKARGVRPLPRCAGCRGRAGNPRFGWSDDASSIAPPDVHDERSFGQRPRAVAPLCEELARAGARSIAHASASMLDGGTFLDHLRGVHRILSLWGETEALCLAGLFHSVYGTSVFDTALFGPEDRPRVGELVGREAERLVFLFSTVDRASLEASAAAPDEPIVVDNWRTGERTQLSAEDAASLAILDAANLVEQAYAPGGGPSLWISRVAERLHRRCLPGRLPRAFVGVEPNVEIEEQALTTYERAIACAAPRRAIRLFLEAAALVSLPGEPLVRAAEQALVVGDVVLAQRLATEGTFRLRASGLAWDKRRSYDAWLGAATRVARGQGAVR